MRKFLFEAVGPQKIRALENLASTLEHSREAARGLTRKSIQLSGEEFLNLLQEAMGEQEKQDVIRANQMALRRRK